MQLTLASYLAIHVSSAFPKDLWKGPNHYEGAKKNLQLRKVGAASQNQALALNLWPSWLKITRGFPASWKPLGSPPEKEKKLSWGMYTPLCLGFTPGSARSLAGLEESFAVHWKKPNLVMYKASTLLYNLKCSVLILKPKSS